MEAKWTKTGEQWQCTCNGHQLTVRKVRAAYDGYINNECVLRMSSPEKTQRRLIHEIERNGGSHTPSAT